MIQTTNLEQLLEEFFGEIKLKIGVQPIYTPHETEEDVDIEIKNILAMANENDDHKEVISLIIKSIKYGRKTDVAIDENSYSELRDMEKFVIKVAYLSRLLYRFGEDVIIKYQNHTDTETYLNIQEKYPIDDFNYIGYKVETNFHKYCINLKKRMLELHYGWLSYIVDVEKIIVGDLSKEDIYDKYLIKFNGFNVKHAIALTTQFKLDFESDIDIIIEMLLNKDNLDIENIEAVMEKSRSILL